MNTLTLVDRDHPCIQDVHVNSIKQVRLQKLTGGGNSNVGSSFTKKKIDKKDSGERKNLSLVKQLKSQGKGKPI